MCGIVGYIGKTYSLAELERFIRLGCQTLAHRGPDDQHWKVGPDSALGATRLAIRDGAGGKQPMHRNGVTLVFNGELYGCASLRKKLKSRGYFFETTSDTEVLLCAFLEEGPAIFGRLSGMFACALWDKKEQKLYLARDRWGEKPLYYTLGKDFIAFASEIKGLRAWPSVDWEVEAEDIPVFLKNSYLPSPKTGWKNIFKLEPGSFLVWEGGQAARRKYFELSVVTEHKSAAELFHLLGRSVKNCLESDRPIGAFLSGGLDSTTVAYFLSQYRPRAPVFSLHWEERDYSEEEYTRTAASAFGLQHVTVKCDAAFFMDHFEAIVGLYDEPFADESMVPTFCLAKLAKAHVDVVLTGDGADEFFHGYDRYFFSGTAKEFREVFAAMPSPLLQQICPDLLQSEPESLLNGEKRTRSLFDIQSYLPDDILMKVDRACMGVGLEARAPFLTPEVTDFALQCPIEQLEGSSKRGKEILRQAMQGHLPDLILKRKKMGFGVPLNAWLRSSMRDWMCSRMLKGSLQKTGWFSQKGLEKLILDHLEGRGNYARPLLNLLVLEVWLASASGRGCCPLKRSDDAQSCLSPSSTIGCLKAHQ